MPKRQSVEGNVCCSQGHPPSRGTPTARGAATLSADLDRLPVGKIDRLTKPLARFLAIEAAAAGLLLLCTAVALAAANSPWDRLFLSIWETEIGVSAGSVELSRSLRAWINDGLMTLFFFVVALELKRELVLGELNSLRLAALSITGAVGGMLVPAGVFLALQPGSGGWGTVMATDTAFVVGCLALLGQRIPPSLRVFMLSLAITDDIGAIVVVTLGYSADVSWSMLIAAACGLCTVKAMGWAGVRSFPAYFLIGGLIWLSVDASGIHPTVTGVVLGLLTPTRRWVSDQRLRAIFSRVAVKPREDLTRTDSEWRALHDTGIAARETTSPVERLEIGLHPWVGFAAMPLFALANAGIPFSIADAINPLSGAVVVAFVLGKPLGVVMFSWLAVKSGLAVLPATLTWQTLMGGALLSGIGFTMALFIANLAFPPEALNAAKLGILGASVIAAVAGFATLRFQRQH